MFALRVFRRPNFEHRDFGVQLGWGLVNLSATMVRSSGARELSVAVSRGSGVQGLRGFGIGLKGLVGYGVQRFGLWRFRGIGFEGSGVYRV